MAEKTRPVSLRLRESDIENLKARAYPLSSTVAGVARDLILTGLAGGDNKALADRLMRIERKLIAMEQLARDTNEKVESADRAARDLLAMFDALLKALSGQSDGRTA